MADEGRGRDHKQLCVVPVLWQEAISCVPWSEGEVNSAIPAPWSVRCPWSPVHRGIRIWVDCLAASVWVPVSPEKAVSEVVGVERSMGWTKIVP